MPGPHGIKHPERNTTVTSFVVGQLTKWTPLRMSGSVAPQKMKAAMQSTFMHAAVQRCTSGVLRFQASQHITHNTHQVQHLAATAECLKQHD